MRTQTRSSEIAPFAAALAICVGAVAWYFDPSDSLKIAIAMFMPVGALAGLEALRHSKFTACETPAAFRLAELMLVATTVFLTIALAMKAMDAAGVIDDGDREMRRKTMGVLYGGLIMFMGNEFPRVLHPLSRLGEKAALKQAAQRFAGWTFVFAGAAYAMIWLALPAERADTIGFWVWPAACAAIVAHKVVAVRRVAA